MFYTAYVVNSLELFNFNTKGQTMYIENLTEELQNLSQNSRYFLVFSRCL